MGTVRLENSKRWLTCREPERIGRQRIACSVSAEKGKCVYVCMREIKSKSEVKRIQDRDRKRKDNE